ncbi:MAG: SRPBCC domain-containing protein [Thermoanaerobaculia bacterium]
MHTTRILGSIVFGVLGTVATLVAQQPMNMKATTGALPKAITIHQEVDFKASPQRVYDALLDGKQFTAFSERAAEINREAGGAFSLFGGHIVGLNIELIPNQRIVQAWRVVTWPDGVYSIARFDLKPQGSGTHLVFEHTAFPDDQRDHLAAGWEENYWTPLRKYFP